MQPVIGKVAVGDVLKGTKNLRNYLRARSLQDRIRKVINNPNHKPAKLYTPSKKDNFVVAVNAWDRFGVWCEREEIVLYWCNFSPKQPAPKHYKQPVPEYMSPSIFSKWFVKTNDKRPQVDLWPDYAYAMWTLLNLNAAGTGEFHLDLGNLVIGPFRHKENLVSCFQNPIKIEAKRNLLRAIKTGHTRELELSKKAHHMPRWTGFKGGPRIEDIKDIREEIHDMLSNQRQRLQVLKFFPEASKELSSHC